MSKGFDCATPVKASQAQQLASMGLTFACRYLVPASLAWKRMIRGEAEALSATGLKIVSVFESAADRARGGAANGKEDGAAAFKEAQTISQPAGSAIYFAVDYNAGAADYDAIADYLAAAEAQIPGYKVGVYGSYAVIEEMARRGLNIHFWQTYAWSRGKKSAHACIYQYSNGESLAGVSLDLNESYGGEGWWNTKPIEKEDNYLMKQKDAEAVIRLLSASHELTTDKQARDEIHRLANEVRKAAGMPVT